MSDPTLLVLRLNLAALSVVVACGVLVPACNPGPPPYDLGSSSAGDADVAPLSGDDGGDEDEAQTVAPWEGGSATETVDSSVVATVDAGAPAPVPDAGPAGACVDPPGPGDLIIDELMIESVEGTGDDGEWLEVMSTLPCTVNLYGLQGQCPVGAKVHSFDVTEDLWLPPGGIFLIADSADPAVNHDLPGTVLTWSGQPGDVLRNEGGTVTLLSGSAIVDSLTWPKLTLVPGTSVAFPADCPASTRQDFTAWQLSTASWFPAFYGTPNAPNDDVQCQ